MQIKETITGSEPITVSEVKSHLKIDFTNDDTLIANLITGIRQNVERYTGLSLIAKTIEYFDEDIEEIVKLPYPEHLAIVEVKLNGTVSTAYKKTGLTQFILKITDTSQSDDNESGLYVKYTTSGTCIQAIKDEMLKAIDEKYRNRGNTFEGAISVLSENTYSNLSKFCLM